jgi:hypothetical protein
VSDKNFGPILLFLRMTKRFLKKLEKGKSKHLDDDANEIAEGFEELLHIELKSRDINYITEAINITYKTQLDELFETLARSFVPQFILSNDFLAYFDQSNKKQEYLEASNKVGKRSVFCFYY